MQVTQFVLRVILRLLFEPNVGHAQGLTAFLSQTLLKKDYLCLGYQSRFFQMSHYCRLLVRLFEYWWIGLIVLIVAALALGGTYFALVWFFGKMKFKDEDKEALERYSNAPRKEKKEIARQTTGAAKKVMTWRGMRSWLIPTTAVVALIVSAAVSFLPSTAFENLLITLGGSKVTIIDTPASREAAAQAEKNVVSIQEEGTVLLKNRNNALPLQFRNKQQSEPFWFCCLWFVLW